MDSYIIHDRFVSVNNVLRKFDDMKEEVKRFWCEMNVIVNKLLLPGDNFMPKIH